MPSLLERLTPPDTPGREVPVLGLAGAPGAGKTTLARRWAAAGPGHVVLSLDDFYFDPETRAPRVAMSSPPGGCRPNAIDASAHP